LQITRVELKNIKNHAEGEWRFQPGVIAICGPNGAGKTTILEAIAWALFDHLDYKRDDFVKRGTKRGQVAIAFISDLDNREYVVTRDTGGSYHVYDPATKTRLAEQKNQVIPWLCQHLGVEQGTDLSALFKTTIGVPQGAFTHDFTLAPSNRKNVFDQILKVEEYRRASDNLRDTLRHIENLIVEANKKLAEAEGELKAYEETRRSHDETELRLQSLEGEQAAVIAERDRLQREVELLNELQQKIESHRRAIEQLRVRLEVKRDSLASAREGVEQARAAADTIERSRRGYENYISASNSLTDLEKRRESRDELRSRITAIEHDLIEARSQSKLCQERLREIDISRDDLARLSGGIEEQNATEAKIAQLREGRGELQGLQRRLEAINRELENLRTRYSSLYGQIETAEAQREKAVLVEPLETDRARLDAEISRAELALNNYRLKRDHLETLRKERARLVVELEQSQREITRLDPLAIAAARLSEIEVRLQDQTDELARLRAEVARDEEMIRALDQGGICPLLTEKCLNLKPGESLDGRFRFGLDARRIEIERLQSALVELGEDVKRSRAAAIETSRLPHLQSERVRLSDELALQQKQIAAIEEDISSGSQLGETEIEKLKAQRSEIETQLRESREAERIFNRAEVLRSEIAQVATEGEVKKGEREEIVKRITRLGDIGAQLAEAESALKSLGDPRGRAAALDRIIAREDELKREMETAESKTALINAVLEQASNQLLAFASLDAEISAAVQMRAASERDYQAFIANEKIAATVASREQEMDGLAREIEHTEKALSTSAGELSEFEKHYDAGRHLRTQSELEGLRERATQLAAQIEHTRQHHSRLQQQLIYLNEVRERMREQIAERERAQRLRETADFIRDILQAAAPYITESYLFSISIEANHLFREITGRFDVTLRWTKDYEITVEEEGRERPFLNLSGGEQMAAALAVRLALLKELSEVNIAFFDEPTTNMDEERRRNLAQQIGRIKDFHQLFVISHDDSFEGYTDQIVSLA
jgi:exonuclease SbcC